MNNQDYPIPADMKTYYAKISISISEDMYTGDCRFMICETTSLKATAEGNKH